VNEEPPAGVLVEGVVFGVSSTGVSWVGVCPADVSGVVDGVVEAGVVEAGVVEAGVVRVAVRGVGAAGEVVHAVQSTEGGPGLSARATGALTPAGARRAAR
jgi:hypothetical protein